MPALLAPATVLALILVLAVGLLGPGGGLPAPSAVERVGTDVSTPSADVAVIRPAASPTPSPTPAAASIAPTATPAATSTPLRLSPALAEQLKSALAAARKKYAMPGVSAAILWPDGRLWTGASGLVDIATGQRMTNVTEFSIGSITKTFTASLVLRLTERHVLSLDDLLSRWLPDYPGGATITLRQMLDHTSGLYDFFGSWTLDAALQKDKNRFWRPADVLSYVEAPVFPPGKGWEYSNTNYLLLGLVIEKATGRTYAEELRAEILAPLELESTWLQGYESPRGQLSHGYDFYTLDPKERARDWSNGSQVMPFISVATAAWSAGGLASTPSDLARWARALYGGSVISADSLASMTDVSVAMAAGPNVEYGLGFQEQTLAGRRTWGHSGRLAGYRTSMRYLPDQGVAIVVLTNQDRWDPDRVVSALIDVAMPMVPGPGPRRL